MEHRVPPDSREIFPGVSLKVSVRSGYSVERDGEYIGWIHASVGTYWNAYVRRPGTSGDHVGRHTQEDAVSAIVAAWDAGVALPNGCRS